MIQNPLIKPESDWLPPKVSDLPSWKGVKRVSVDLETHDEHLTELGPGVRRGAYICGYSFGFEDGPKFYVPTRHELGDNVDDPEQAMRYLADQAKVFDGVLVGANLSYELDFLSEVGIEFPMVSFFRDVLLADPLINELQQRYNLDAVCKRHGIEGKDESLLREAAGAYGVDPKGGMWMLPARYVGAYGEADADRPLRVLRRQERILEEQGLEDAFNLESRVLPALVRMRRRGVRIDQERLEDIEVWSLEEEAKALQEIKKLTGVSIEIDSVMAASAVVPALEKAGVHIGTTATGKDSVKRDILEASDHPVAKLIIRARKVNKLRTTFAASIRRYMINGRIHCDINQLARDREDGTPGGARYGRMSSSNPNMQQQPSRDEFADRWKSIYLPEEGAEWAAPDYSQQEPRMLVHYAVLARCSGARDIAQMYWDDPNLDNHDMIAQLTGLDRYSAKAIFLMKIYGAGDGKVARELGHPTTTKVHPVSGRTYQGAGPKTQAILDKFNSRVPFLRELTQKCQRAAERKGYVTLLDGRRCRFPMRGGRYDWTHKALNRVIQGSSAVQTKIALVYADAAGIFLQLPIHDELTSSVGDRSEARTVRDIMRDCVPLKVPCKVNVKIGPSWGEAQKVDL